jgi:3-phosphoglycerate kinase
MELRTLNDYDFSNKRVIIRVDYNVPTDNNRKITDNTRIVASLDTINFLHNKGARIILMSHLGRPECIDEKLRLDEVAYELQKELSRRSTNLIVIKFDDCIGENIKKRILSGNANEIYLLENLRFHKEEEENNRDFAGSLADLADCYVSDAFGTVHRAHASTAGISEFLPSFAGLLVEKEARSIGQIVENPQKPLISIIGCAKIKDKLATVKNLLERSDKVIFGGAIVFSFFKVMGYEIGKSICEKDLSMIKDLYNTYKSKIILPIDIVVSDSPKEPLNVTIVNSNAISANQLGVDVGPRSIELFKKELNDARTVVWNGPLGIFEVKEFAKGTIEIAEYLSHMKSRGVFTVLGGGDTVAAIKNFSFDSFSHVSTGGGAFLEFLEGRDLPGIAILKKNTHTNTTDNRTINITKRDDSITGFSKSTLFVRK